ncbi:hypothetical protein M0805_003189 [Coniferiporia weirii]|nr:hypothetical protein M0805_003189 [Coniferiporia weirii]
MVTQPVFRIVAQRLLDLFRQWAHRSLCGILCLIRVLRRHIGSIAKDDGHYPSTRDELQLFSDHQNTLEPGNSPTGSIGTGGKALTTLHSSIGDGIGHHVCSSLPGTPSERAIEPAPRSSASYNSIGIVSSDDDEQFRGMAILEEGLGVSGAILAEPTHILAISEGRLLQCTAPSLRPRYDRNIEIKSIVESEEWCFRPFGTFAVQKKDNIPLWKPYTHPGGQIYYLRERCGFIYLTEANLDEKNIRDDIESIMTEIERKAIESNEQLSAEVEVLLEHNDEGWSYYLMDFDRDQGCIFWFDKFDASQLIPRRFGIEKTNHLCHLLDYEYWMHVENFPCHRKLKERVLKELLGILNFYVISFTTSSESTSPYDSTETHSLIKSVEHLQALYAANESLEYVTFGAANERFYNFHGHHGVRLGVGQSVRGSVPKKRSWLIKLLSPVLFYAPETHLVMLEKLYVDEMIKALRWRPFQSKLQDDWDAFVLISTVLLSANVAFLAVPSVQAVVGSNQELWTSTATVPSLVSIVTSLGSIIIGLLLKRQLRISTKDTEFSAADAVTYLQKRKHPQLGLETMAIQYSLPYALLMWSMTTFFASVVIVCFLNVNDTATTFARVIYGVVWMFVVVLILWTIFTGLETTTSINWRDFNLPLWTLWRKANSDAGSDADEDEKNDARDSDARSQRSPHGSTSTCATRRTRPWQRLNPMRGFTFITGKRSHKAQNLQRE